jgi:hypothetical protein
MFMQIKVKFIVNYFRSRPFKHCPNIRPAFRGIKDMGNKTSGSVTRNDYGFKKKYNRRIAS